MLVKVLNSLDAKYILLVRVVLETESPFVNGFCSSVSFLVL